MNQTIELSGFYQQIQQNGKLLTPDQAQRWSYAVLATLGINLDRKTKKRLAKGLPADLAATLSRVFWLAHFKNSGQTVDEFLNQVARRSGNTNVNFARFPTTAVFRALKEMIDSELVDLVSIALSPDVSKFWQQA